MSIASFPQLLSRLEGNPLVSPTHPLILRAEQLSVAHFPIASRRVSEYRQLLRGIRVYILRDSYLIHDK